MGDRSSRLLAPPASAPKLTREETVKLESANGLRQADRMFELIDHALASATFRLRPSTLIELNRLAVAGLVAAPGAFRVGAMRIDESQHQPPPPEDVAAYVDDLCDYVASSWNTSSAIHLSSYVLWRLNWIHPFEDGNGRTARAAAYLALCVRLGHKLPGSRTIPEVIANDKAPYYEALEGADAAWKNGELDLQQMDTFMQSCLAAQLIAIVHQASSKPIAAGDSTLPMASPPAAGTSPSFSPSIREATKPRVFVGSSTEGLSIAETIQVGLEYDAHVTLWSQEVFQLSTGPMDALKKATTEYDFAVLVLTPDDKLESRGSEQPTARDNVLFELGLFIGSFGQHRTFIVHARDQDLRIPSDLVGLTAATYDAERAKSEPQAALGTVCTKLKRAIRDQGARKRIP